MLGVLFPFEAARALSADGVADRAAEVTFHRAMLRFEESLASGFQDPLTWIRSGNDGKHHTIGTMIPLTNTVLHDLQSATLQVLDSFSASAFESHSDNIVHALRNMTCLCQVLLYVAVFTSHDAMDPIFEKLTTHVLEEPAPADASEPPAEQVSAPEATTPSDNAIVVPKRIPTETADMAAYAKSLQSSLDAILGHVSTLQELIGGVCACLTKLRGRLGDDFMKDFGDYENPVQLSADFDSTVDAIKKLMKYIIFCFNVAASPDSHKIEGADATNHYKASLVEFSKLHSEFQESGCLNIVTDPSFSDQDVLEEMSTSFQDFMEVWGVYVFDQHAGSTMARCIATVVDLGFSLSSVHEDVLKAAAPNILFSLLLEESQDKPLIRSERFEFDRDNVCTLQTIADSPHRHAFNAMFDFVEASRMESISCPRLFAGGQMADIPCEVARAALEMLVLVKDVGILGRILHDRLFVPTATSGKAARDDCTG